MGKVIGFILAFLLMSTPAWATILVLSWTDNSNNEMGFVVERREGATGTFVEVGGVTANVERFVNTVPDNKVYCYIVWAFNNVGRSIQSTNIACNADGTGSSLPLPATNLTVSEIQVQ